MDREIIGERMRFLMPIAVELFFGIRLRAITLTREIGIQVVLINTFVYDGTTVYLTWTGGYY
jgi:hypothetical protein